METLKRRSLQRFVELSRWRGVDATDSEQPRGMGYSGR